MFLLLFISFVFARDTFSGQLSMNEINPADYKQFSREWPLVTVRYRKDTQEMRFTYANEKALSALKNKNKNYPNGAVFAKIGIKTLEDPAFTSSVIPAGARRIQFMVRDTKKYKSTNGWGYALFDENGKTFPEDPKTMVMACAACHNLVPDRGYVFSQLMPQWNSMAMENPKAQIPIRFKTIPYSNIPNDIKKHLPKEYREYRSLDSSLKQSSFAGTLDEVRPILTKEFFLSGKPTLFFTDDHHGFSLVIKGDKLDCIPPEVALKAIHKYKENSENVVEYCAKN
jgi:hypothetical protein